MDKLSSDQIVEVLSEASGTLRKQAERIEALEGELASRDQRVRVEKLASEMHRKNINADISLDVLADNLMKLASEGKLDAMEQGVEMVGPDMGSKIAQLVTDDQRVTGGGGSDLERFVLSGSVG